MATQATVFIVDDEPEVRTALATVAELMGFEPRVFESAAAFLAGYDWTRAGCLLVDLRMPEVSGIELLEILARRKWRIPAVMLSGHGDVSAAVRAMKCGAIDFLEKPYSLDALRQSIVRAIDLDMRCRAEETGRRQLTQAIESLTVDERRVLELTTDGKPDKAIAARLGLSTRTIQLRRASLMRKMSVNSRTELIRLSRWLERDSTFGSPPHVESESWGFIASSG